MKKLFLLGVCIVACASVLKAQTLIPLKPLEKGLANPFGIDSSLSVQKGWPVPDRLKALPMQPFVNITANQFKSNMPVIALASTDRMPVLHLGDTGKMHYTIMIAPLGGKMLSEKQMP